MKFIQQFDFGENWVDFSNAVSSESFNQARQQFLELTGEVINEDKSFLDVGFGQGFNLLSATVQGMDVVGCDINPKCAEALKINVEHFGLDGANEKVHIHIGSILDDSTISLLADDTLSDNGQFDIVHSWGVLHHTGNMNKAIDNAVSLVKPGGHFVVALYNKHWTSPIWTGIKWFYCHVPSFIQKAMVHTLYGVIWLAKLVVTRKNPFKMQRGMNFYHDVVDWVGGYPYEYASQKEVVEMLKMHGMSLEKVIPAEVPTGCNQFVFVKLL